MDDRIRDPFTLTIGGSRDSRATLKIVNNKFVIGKEEFYPHVAEMHYFQVAKRHWSICFERIRKANFRIISTAVPWNIHEARQGDFDFSGISDPSTDLVVFLELCREFGFRIMLRPGPWIGQELDAGGIPDFAIRPEMAATGHNGKPIVADPGGGAKVANLPSYLGNRFQIQLKNYFTVFTEVVRNYIYPRGPVFMIELDHETSFGGHFDPLSADFSPAGSRGQLPVFLEEKYSDLDRLNRIWKSKFKDFSDAQPPDNGVIKAQGDLVRLMDWVEFREWVVNRYAASLAEFMSQTEVLVLFARSLAFHGAYHFPKSGPSDPNGRVLYTVNLDWSIPFGDLIRRARSVSGWQATGFSTKIAVGDTATEGDDAQPEERITPSDTRRLIVTALAAGIKGFNFHMFVGRPRWTDSAVEADGAVGASYEVVESAVNRLMAARYEQMRDFADVAMVEYRPYLRIATLSEDSEYAYMGELVGPGFNAVASDLMALGHDYRVFNLETDARLDRFGTIIIPCGELMDAAEQEVLAALYKGGAHLILYGLLPRMTTQFEPCDILAKAIGFQTVAENQTGTIDVKARAFQSRLYGTIKRTPSRASKLAKVGSKLVAATNKTGKGTITVMTLSPGSLLHPDKLVFFREVLESGKLTTPVFSSDPRTHVVLHGHQKAAMLMIYHTAEITGVPDHVSDSPASRNIIVGADLTPTGLSSPKVTMHEVFRGDSIRVAPKDLKNGIEIRIGRGDSRLFIIEKR